MKILIKTLSGLLPGDPDSEIWYQKIRTGVAISVEAHTIRNYQFLKKWFALLNIGYDAWEPVAANKEQIKALHLPEKTIPKKTFDSWRKDVIILTGRYETVFRANGDLRIIAKSVSFSNMAEEEFEQLYSDTIDILLKHCFSLETTRKELDETVNKILGFC